MSGEEANDTDFKYGEENKEEEEKFDNWFVYDSSSIAGGALPMCDSQLDIAINSSVPTPVDRNPLTYKMKIV